jgi:hypothetical protein
MTGKIRATLLVGEILVLPLTKGELEGVGKTRGYTSNPILRERTFLVLPLTKGELEGVKQACGYTGTQS